MSHASIAEMVTLDLDSDKFRCFNHRRRTQQRSTASELQIGRDMARAIYSARLAIFIYGITSAKRTREVRPAVLVRENSTQLLMYSLDTCIRYSTYSPIFKSQKGSMEALNFRIVTS
jgi:hypothetical protein